MTPVVFNSYLSTKIGAKMDGPNRLSIKKYACFGTSKSALMDKAKPLYPMSEPFATKFSRPQRR